MVISPDRWKRFSFCEQMGNIASELARADRYFSAENGEQLRESLWRALELLDLTIDTQRRRARLRELCRFREAMCDIYCGTNIYAIEPGELMRYALDFGMLARR